MKITRVTNPEISIYLLPWFVEDTQTAMEIGMELNDRMLNKPDDTCVLLATDKGMTKAVLVGYIEEDHLFLWQAKKSKDMNCPRMFFQRLCQWGREKGMDRAQLMSSDKRVRRLYKRKYGFTSVGGPVMEKQL